MCVCGALRPCRSSSAGGGGGSDGGGGGGTGDNNTILFTRPALFSFADKMQSYYVREAYSSRTGERMRCAGGRAYEREGKQERSILLEWPLLYEGGYVLACGNVSLSS